MLSGVRLLVIGLVLSAGTGMSIGCHASRHASGQDAAATTQPAVGGVPVQPHDVDSAPVLVVWRKPSSGNSSITPRLEYAVWADGVVVFRRDLPNEPQTLMLGRVEPEDVQFALDAMDGKGFFRSEPYEFSKDGLIIMARNKGRANTMTADRPLATIPETPAEKPPQSIAPHVPLWNTAVDSITGLREVMGSSRLSTSLDSAGEYRGYNDRMPSGTWWISDAGTLWKPANTAATAPVNRH